MRIDPAPQVEAPLAFVGYGLSIPELKIDDLAGQDLRGKVVVYLVGSPAGVPDALSAHAQSAAVRWAALKQAGAHRRHRAAASAAGASRPGSASTLARLQPAMSLADAGAATTPPASRSRSPSTRPTPSACSPGSGHTFAEMVALADERKPLPGFPLPSRGPRHGDGRDDGRSPRTTWPACWSAATRRCATNTSCVTATSITSASAARSTATASTTARWTTPRASPA